MKSGNIFLTFLSIILLIPVILCTDYCEVEKKSCGTKKHIACAKNVFNSTVEPYKVEVMTDDLIQFILNKLNAFRSDIATGKYENDSFDISSNMRTIRWNYEFSRLSELSLKKFKFGDFPGCVNTDEFNRTLETHHIRPNIFSNEELFRVVLDDQTADAITNEVSPYYQASIYEVGCAFGRLVDEYGKTKNLIKCIYNDAFLRPLKNAYLKDIPCSECFIYNEICDFELKHVGLCVPMSTINGSQHLSFNYWTGIILLLVFLWNKIR